MSPSQHKLFTACSLCLIVGCALFAVKSENVFAYKLLASASLVITVFMAKHHQRLDVND